jgi:hypothetical protein
MKTVVAYQGLRSWNQLPPQKSECGSQRFESKVPEDPASLAPTGGYVVAGMTFYEHEFGVPSQ